jgi:GNAT superfamily N-acetyltransferase
MRADAPAGYAIRTRLPTDDAALVRVENAANRLLAAHGYPDLAEHGIPDVGYLRRMIGGGDVFVAVAPDGAPAGFAVAQPQGGRLHLRELSVDPAHGRQGLGAALVRAVIERARSLGLAGVSLTTFRTVPFNAPFYARLGFRESDDKNLAQTLLREVPDGVDLSERVAMVLDFRSMSQPTMRLY